MSETAPGLVTILFTDLVGSTELLARAGDEEAQAIFRAHRHLLADAVAAHGGHEVKWLGDGLMVAFPSAADAIGCAIDMQQASRRPVHGEDLAIRVGLNAGEALRDVDDYFGTPVVVARRLCDRAEGGQILCTETVAGLLAGRGGFTFVDLGKLALKGVPEPVAACEVFYERTPTQELPARPPMVGRDAEFDRLSERLADAVAGRGGLATVTGEPGIGKTRMLEELAEQAVRQGAQVLVGRCFESEWAPPYGPFADALGAHVTTVDAPELRADLGPGAPPLAQLVPKVREILPDIPDPVPVQPDEERFRLIDAVAQFLVARARRGPVLICLDDLQWADKGTVAMLRHIARLAPKYRVLVVGAYRDADIDKSHPLTDVLQALTRETEFVYVKLEPMAVEGVHALLESIAQHPLPAKVGAAWAQEVGGNPFFIEEMVKHLHETGDLYRDESGRWATTRPIRELTVPEGVHNVVARRLSRLSETANKLLGVASPFEVTFRFDVVARVAGVNELDGLDALDEVLMAQVVKAAGADNYAFANTLIRQSLYNELSPSRQMRLHRRVAEALEEIYGERPAPAQAGEIAAQFYRSAGLSGAERGVEPALIAAGHAQATGAHDEAAVFLRMALQMLPPGDARRPRLQGRLGVVLAWALDFDEAVTVATEAGGAIAETEDKRAAAEYLSDAAYACAMAGGIMPSWRLAQTGLTYAGARDIPWARLICFDYQRREAEDPAHPGIPTESTERREAARILREARLDPMGPSPMEAVFDSQEEALSSTNFVVLCCWAGEYARCVPLFETEAGEAESLGRLARAARCHAFVAMCQAALGHLNEARTALEKAQALATRLGTPIFPVLQAQDNLALAADEGWELLSVTVGPIASSKHPALAWALGTLNAIAARSAARRGEIDEALAFLDPLLAWLERAPAWTPCFPLIACNAAEVLWLVERTDHLELIDQTLRDRVVASDFRYPMTDGRLALARLCALQGHNDEAKVWFAEARRVLTEQEARPLLAIAFHDEALMHLRRNGPGDSEAARPLLERARAEFDAIGMTGWLRTRN
ncbi:MAG TPA: AAA family ATPase [Acidimicrobiia bacterium]|nr:AAA family ATPase [Acidimicrobiia bacterium]